jgi:membrane-bound inhibitor of C-type lysozyme
MRYLPIACLALAACTPGPGNDTLTADENAIINIDAIDSQRDQGVPPEPLAPPAPGTPGGLPDDRTPINEAPQPEESAQGAATVLERYYAMLEAGQYRQAWQLWGDGGRASGMSVDAFAAGFARYAEYHANIGAPGAIEAGAGQRYVTVPVQVYGRLKAGNKPFYMIGSVTLQRSVVDGATDEAKRWRLRSAALKPRPGQAVVPSPETSVDNRSTARYRCMDGGRMTARFDPDNGQVTVIRGGKQLGVLTQQRTASGIAYSGGGYALRGKGEAMTFTAPGQPPIACTAIR